MKNSEYGASTWKLPKITITKENNTPAEYVPEQGNPITVFGYLLGAACGVIVGSIITYLLIKFL